MINDDVNVKRPIVFIVETPKVTPKAENTKYDFRKYNWVDARDFAKELFRDYAFEMPWAEDMWNILMFDDVVISKNIATADFGSYENGDIILWLAAMCDFLYDYKIVIYLERNYNRLPLIEHAYNIDNAQDYIYGYLKAEAEDKIHKAITNEQMSGDYCDEDYDLLYDDFYEEIFKEIYNEEVIRRREIVKNRIYDHFNNDSFLIMQFMVGIHWYDNYLNVDNYAENERNKILNKYERILKLIRDGKLVRYIDEKTNYLYEEEFEVESDMDEELRELERYHNGFKSDIEPLAVYSWVENGMIY